MSEKIRRELGKNIKKLRREKGETQEITSKNLYISRSCLGNYEIGSRTPDAITLERFASYFGVEISALLGNKDA